MTASARDPLPLYDNPCQCSKRRVTILRNVQPLTTSLNHIPNQPSHFFASQSAEFRIDYVYRMDVDPAVEPELDTFSLILPLPYRIAVIFVLGKRSRLVTLDKTQLTRSGIWAWGVNLHYLSLLKIVRSRPFAPANSRAKQLPRMFQH